MERSSSSPENSNKNLYSLIDEPKTLSDAEMSDLKARASEVIKKYGHEEAGRIFLQGLKPVVTDPPKPEKKDA